MSLECLIWIWVGDRGDVYRGTEWVDRVSSWDALWTYSCALHLDNQRVGCNGRKETLFVYSFASSHKSTTSWFLSLMICFQLDKYKNYDFGRCPRVYCCGQPCLPVGLSDLPRSSTVKIYCPKCQDIYYPRSKYQGSILFFCLTLSLLTDTLSIMQSSEISCLILMQ